MPTFTVRMRGVTLGWADLALIDHGMGVVGGSFRPGIGYPLVQPVFRLYAEAIGETSAVPTDDGKLRRFYAARERLALTVHAPDGTLLPAEQVQIYDFTEESGPGALTLEVFLADREAWERATGGG